MLRYFFLTWMCCLASSSVIAADESLRLLFLGDNGHHRPAERFAQLAPVMEQRNIALKYTDEPKALNAETLSQFDGLIVYANHESITPEQETALLQYVASGKGFVPLHCATYCFLNSPKYIELVGGQFQKHGTGTVSTRIVNGEHPLMRGFGGFESWDETYVHHRTTNDRTILEVRPGGMQADGNEVEPWTWVRTHGNGRVFYTAWGHDARTWSHPGFHNLIERGIRWACDRDLSEIAEYKERKRFETPEMTKVPDGLPKFEYIDVGPKIPNYTASEKWGTQGEARSLMQKPLTPEESLKHYVTPVGMELQLHAAEPQLGGKPISMNWDHRGRLWVCETVDYPNELQPENRGRDRIRICEDVDRDGKADKFTVFAENLSIPTAIAFARGGAIVQNGTQTLFLKDTDGDDKADVKTVLIDNWKLGDTHGGVSNIRYGLDGWFWGMQGYNDSKPIINGEQQPGFRMGFFRFRLDNADPPKVAELEFVRSTSNNTWGLGISEEGLIFGSTANHYPSYFMPIPNRYYEKVRGWTPDLMADYIADSHLFDPITDKVRQVDHHGGYTAGAGHALYTARAYPEQWWNRTAFVCGPTGHLVGTFVLNRDGASFKSHSPCNLVAADDEWAAPIMAEVGPDGCVWVLDWYNYIVQHNPTPRGFKTGKGNAYETDLRDKKHGRIIRVVSTEPMNFAMLWEPLDTADPKKLVRYLTHPTMLWRLHAQRLLIERGETDIVPQLVKLVQDQSYDAIGLNPGAIHALQTLRGLGVIDQDQTVRNAVESALKHPSAGVRRNAIQVLPNDDQAIDPLAESGVFDDLDAQVRLAAYLKLADLPASPDAAIATVSSANNAANHVSREQRNNRWLIDALTSAAANQGTDFFRQLARYEFKSEPQADLVAITERTAEHIGRGGSSTDAPLFVKYLVSMNPTLATATIVGLERGWPANRASEMYHEDAKQLVDLAETLPPTAVPPLVSLASRWGTSVLDGQVTKIVNAFLKSIRDESKSLEERSAAARQLVAFRPNDAKATKKLLNLITPRTAPPLAEALIAATQRSQVSEVGETLVELVPNATPAVRRIALQTLMSRPDWTETLVDGLADGDVQLSDLSLDQQTALGNHPNQAIREAAQKVMQAGGGLPNPDREKVLQALLAVTEQHGDAKRGFEMYKKHCAKCHVHGKEGQKVGPELTGMAVHPKVEFLTNIIDPSRSVEGNFRSYTVLTSEGRVFTGMLAAESRTAVELVDTEGKRHAIPREDIEELIASKKSIMPEGFEKQMSAEELTDLLEFLTQKGRFVQLPLAKAATAISTTPLFHTAPNGLDRMIFADWSPKTFHDVPFSVIDPDGGRQRNIILLHGPQGSQPPRMPKSVSLPCNTSATVIHFLSGVSGWGFPAHRGSTVSMTVRLHYADGETEDHDLLNGREFADYIRRVDVPGSEFAFRLEGGQQVRYLNIKPQRPDSIEKIELISGDDPTSPIVMAVTVETRSEDTPSE